MCPEMMAIFQATATGNGCTAHPDLICRFPMHGTTLTQSWPTLSLACACGTRFSLVFRRQATALQLALPFLAVYSKAGPGRMILVELLLCCEIYKNDIVEYKVENLDPSYVP